MMINSPARPSLLSGEGDQIQQPPLPRARRPARRWATWARGVLLLTAVLVLVVVDVHRPDSSAGMAAYLTVTVGAAIVTWLGVRQRPAGDRAAWCWIALGITLSAMGDLIYYMYQMEFGAAPVVSSADIFYLASYAALGLGLLTVVPLRDKEGRIDVPGLLDLVGLATVGTLLVWEYAVGPEWSTQGDQPLLARLVVTAYPLLDAVLLVLVARAFASERGRWAGARLLALGVACWLVSDFAVVINDSLVGWPDAGWMIGAVLIAWSVSVGADRERRAERIREAPSNLPRVRVAVGMSLLLVPALLGLIGYLRDQPENPFMLFGAMVVLVTLVFVQACVWLGDAESARDRMKRSDRHHRALAANSSDAVVLVGDDGLIMTQSDTLAELVGYPGACTVGIDIALLVHRQDVAEVRAMLTKALSAPGIVFETAVRVFHRCGAQLWIGARVVNLIDDPDVGGIVVNLRDVTARKTVEAELEHQAFHDALTGLANRTLFRDRVEHALRRQGRTEASAVVYLDVDGFKTVNDSLGHEAGDQLLCEVARRLQSSVRAGDTVARLGGDEFAILVEASREPYLEAATLADRVLSALSEPMHVSDYEISVSGSMGIAISEPGSSASSLLRNADIAMYQAKSLGKKRWVIYEPEMEAAAVERLRLEVDLAGALEGNQLRLAYQPIVDLATDRVVGFEALLRWEHPTLGEIMPDRFIPIAEENGSIVPIGRWVLETACRMAVRWQHVAGRPEGFTMAVNVSGRQLATSTIVRDVAEALALSGLSPGSLILEMTESVLVKDANVVFERLQRLRELGVRLAIDDFGTGYGSLSYLQYPVDILKIDRSFVSAIGDSPALPAIVRGLLDFGHALRLEIVAEGIEQQGQCDRLRDEHCDMGQGFLFARPLMPEDVEAFLTTFDRVDQTSLR